MIGEKIRAIREENDYTQKDFAKKFNIAYGTLQSYEYGETEPKLKFLENLSKYFKIPMSYFYSDVVNVSSIDKKSVANVSSIDGKSVVTPLNLKLSQNTAENAGRPKNLPINNDDLKSSQIEQIENDSIYIRKLSSNVGAGESVDIDGIEICDTDILVPFSRMLFKIHPKNYYNLRCMRVDGYSMAPMLFPDSWVIAEISPEFNGDGLYIICYCGNFMVKLLQKSPNGILHIKSVNKDYDSYEIGPDDKTEVYIVGRVLRCVI